MLSSKLLLTTGLVLAASACGCVASTPPIKPVTDVDLQRYMGTWYVIASIPTSFEKDAYNAVETYRLDHDGRVDTMFQFRKGSFDAPLKTIDSTGYVGADTGNAVWGVQIIWPIRAQYLVAYLKDDYSQVIVARDARDYTWVMARTPTVSDSDYKALIDQVKELGYPLDKLYKVPQRWPESGVDARSIGVTAAR